MNSVNSLDLQIVILHLFCVVSGCFNSSVGLDLFACTLLTPSVPLKNDLRLYLILSVTIIQPFHLPHVVLGSSQVSDVV